MGDKSPVVDGRQFLCAHRGEELPSKIICHQLADACRSHGYFHLVNSGMDGTIIRRLREAMLWFFDLSVEEKNKIKRSEDNSMGFSDDELTKQSKDLKQIFDFCYVPHPELPASHPLNRTLDGHNRWPENHPEFKKTLDEYFNEMQRCAFKLTEAFCVALGLEAKALHGLFEGGVGFARLNFYDVQPQTVDTEIPPLGIHPHTDAGFLTILLQDEVAGLEMFHNGVWEMVEPITGALTINVGDMCQVLSNDAFRAPLHRVIAPAQRRRYSAAFFFNPSSHANIAPLPRFVSDSTPAAYRPINWGEFRRSRFAGDYADVGEEVQISLYKIQAASLVT